MLDSTDTRNALLADFMQYYHLDIRGLETGDLDPSFIAVLAFELPQGARIWTVLNPNNQFTLSEILLDSVQMSLSAIAMSLGGIKGQPIVSVLEEIKNQAIKNDVQTITSKEREEIRAQILANAGGFEYGIS